MSMTKKEKQRVEDLLTEAALRYTPDVSEPDIPRPEHGETTGYLFMGEGTPFSRVEKYRSTSVTHCSVKSSCGSQGGRAMYSTELRAWKALRNAKEKVYAKELRDIDRKIEQLSGTGLC